LFSFDNTNFNSLGTSESFASEPNFSTDRYYVKSNPADASCQFTALCGLRSSW
jgi:hypothetical protein